MPIIRLDQAQQFAAINVLSDPGAIGGPTVIPFATQILLSWNMADGKVAHNVLYGRNTGVPAPSVAQAQAIFSALTTGALWTAFASHLATVTNLASVTLTSVHTAGLASFVSTGAAVPGSNAAASLPNEVALCVTLRSSGRGPSNRARMYIPGYTVDRVLAGNTVNASTVTDTSNWANNIKSILAAQNLTWAIGQKARSEYIGSTGTLHPARAANCNVDIVTALVKDNRWDSQRRRGLK